MRQQRRRFDFSQLRITRIALIIAALELGLSLIWLLANPAARTSIDSYMTATPDGVWHHGRVWSLVTSPFIERDFLGLILNTMMLWMLIPRLESFWGQGRFIRFVAITSIVATTVGTLVGLATGHNVEIGGLSPFIWASVVAYGIVYAKQPVQFFGVLPLTARQFMFGTIGFLVLFIVLQQKWEEGAGFASAMIAAAIMSSKRWSPTMAYRRWKARRARAQLTVLQGGASAPLAKKKPKDGDWLN